MNDWTTIRTDYISGRGSLRTLARLHNVSFHTLAKVSVRENWPLARRVHADGDRGESEATVPATQTEPRHPMSVTQRSASLKARILSEMETDVGQVEKTPPQNLADSMDRQSVLSSITRVAETVLDWGDKTTPACVRIAVMANTTVQVSDPSPISHATALEVISVKQIVEDSAE